MGWSLLYLTANDQFTDSFASWQITHFHKQAGQTKGAQENEIWIFTCTYYSEVFKYQVPITVSCDSIWLINTHDYQTSMKAYLELWNYGQNSGSCFGRVHSIWRSCPECFVSVLFRIHSPKGINIYWFRLVLNYWQSAGMTIFFKI